MQLLGVVFAAVKSKNGKKIAERERERVVGREREIEIDFYEEKL